MEQDLSLQVNQESPRIGGKVQEMDQGLPRPNSEPCRFEPVHKPVFVHLTSRTSTRFNFNLLP